MPDDSEQFEENQNDESVRHASSRHEKLTQLYESAIEAEQETGRREETEEKAKRSLIVRILSIFAGTIICIIGLIMFVTPGPGLLVLAAGLGILAIDVPFARRLLLIVKNRLPQDEAGKISRRTIITMSITAVLGIAISVVFTWLALTK